MSYAEILPVVNQVELHLYNKKNKLIDFCDKTGIKVVGYRVVFNPPKTGVYSAKDSPLDNEIVQRLAKKYQKSPHQILIRWNLQRNCGTIVKSVTPHRIHENWKTCEFEIEDFDMTELNSIEDQGVFTDSSRLFGLSLE